MRDVPDTYSNGYLQVACNPDGLAVCDFAHMPVQWELFHRCPSNKCRVRPFPGTPTIVPELRANGSNSPSTIFLVLLGRRLSQPLGHPTMVGTRALSALADAVLPSWHCAVAP